MGVRRPKLDLEPVKPGRPWASMALASGLMLYNEMILSLSLSCGQK